MAISDRKTVSVSQTTPKSTSSEAKSVGCRVLKAEAEGLEMLLESIDDNFAKAIDLILESKNYLIVVGVGKSGHIGQKIAASFASTGTPSFFMHPTEASHGDLGMVTPDSIILAIFKFRREP